MKNKKILAILAVAFSASVVMSGCSFFGGDEEEQVVVSTTPTPEAEEEEATPTPTPEAEVAANVQSTTYTSADGSISISLPDATWSNKTDETNTCSFESPDQGNILILHGQGDEAIASTVLPSTQDMAVSLDQADGDKVEGTDFEIQNYTSTDVNGISVYSYTTHMLNTDKSNGELYVVHKVFANDSEYYTIEAGVKTEDALSSIQAAVDSFAILGDSTLKEAAPASEKTDTAASADASGTDASASSGTEADGTATDTASTDSTGDSSADASADSSAAGTDSSADTGITNSGGFSDEQLHNTDETRTLYDNADGRAFVVTPSESGDGTWVDGNGTVYTFAENGIDVYDPSGNSYYYGGEGAWVYYMPVE